MIATLRGEITQIEENALVIEVGGVGLRALVPAPLRGRMKVGETVLVECVGSSVTVPSPADQVSPPSIFELRFPLK